MMKGISLTDLATRIEANRNAKHDLIADTRDMTMQASPSIQPVLEVERQGSYPILPTAHDQIGARLGIPAKYYDRMLQHDPALLATNVNSWFRRDPDKRMVRVLNNNMRAFLSNRYQRIENEEIAEVALPILGDIPDVQIVSCEITNRRMYIHAVAPRVQGEVKKGDIVQAGVVISNSEIGMGSVSVSAMFWRLICLNGAVTGDKFRAYHVGRAVEDSEALWADDTRRADDRAVLLKVRDMVRSAVDETAHAQRLDKMRQLNGLEVKATADPARVVEVLAQKVGVVSDEERGGILNALIRGGDLTAWGLLNAVTNQAHHARNYDRAVEFEEAGGRLLNLNRRDWSEVLEAA